MRIKLFILSALLSVLVFVGLICMAFIFKNSNDNQPLPNTPNPTELADFKKASDKIQAFEVESEKIIWVYYARYGDHLDSADNENTVTLEDIVNTEENIEKLKVISKENVEYLNEHIDSIEACLYFDQVCLDLEIGEDYEQNESEKIFSIKENIEDLNRYYQSAIEKFEELREYCIDLYDHNDGLNYKLSLVQLNSDLAELKVLKYSEEYDILDLICIPDVNKRIEARIKQTAEKEAMLNEWQQYLVVAVIIDIFFIILLIVLIILEVRKKHKSQKYVT